jgi:hypothetical protein
MDVSAAWNPGRDALDAAAFEYANPLPHHNSNLQDQSGSAARDQSGIALRTSWNEHARLSRLRPRAKILAHSGRKAAAATVRRLDPRPYATSTFLPYATGPVLVVKVWTASGAARTVRPSRRCLAGSVETVTLGGHLANRDPAGTARQPR